MWTDRERVVLFRIEFTSSLEPAMLFTGKTFLRFTSFALRFVVVITLKSLHTLM